MKKSSGGMKAVKGKERNLFVFVINDGVVKCSEWMSRFENVCYCRTKDEGEIKDNWGM